MLTEQKRGSLGFTSVLLETDTAMPFSLGMLLELLLGELGPDPGALLHAESEPHKSNTFVKDIQRLRWK